MTTFCVLLSIGVEKGLDCCRVRKLIGVSYILNVGFVYDVINIFMKESILKRNHNVLQISVK